MSVCQGLKGTTQKFESYPGKPDARYAATKDVRNDTWIRIGRWVVGVKIRVVPVCDLQ